MKRIMTILLLCCCGWLSAQSYRVGDLYTAPDGSQGIVFYIYPDGINGWVVALQDASAMCRWGSSSDVPGLTNQTSGYPSNSMQFLLNDTSGYANTQTIRNYQNNSTYAAGVVDFDHGWCLPSPAQLSMLYAQLPFISAALINAGGTDLAPAYYWTSAEYNASRAWLVDFGNGDSGSGNYGSGNFSIYNKFSFCHVRAVRSFTNTPPVYDTALTYVWSTGDTTAAITVASGETTQYTVTVTTSGGCVDSVSKTVVIRHGDTMYVSETACESFVWNGVTYFESGIYTQLFDAALDCDSAVTLVLTITGSPEVNVTVTADTLCEGDSVTLQAVADPFLIVPPVAVGDILCTDGTTVKPAAFAASGKTAFGVVFYVDTTGVHGWAVHLHDVEGYKQWGAYNTVGAVTDIGPLPNIETARVAITDFNGYGNTLQIRNAGDVSIYPAAWAVDFDNGWYLPAAGQLSLLFGNFVTVNQSLQTAGGTTFPMDAIFHYWSSTEYSGDYAFELIYGGDIRSDNKLQMYRVRGVRNF